MWILSILPTPAIHLIVLTGVAGLIITRLFPSINPYHGPIVITSLFLALAGMWLEGAASTKNEYAKELLLAQLKATEAERDAAKANGKIEIVYQDRVKIVKEVQTDLQTKIESISKVIDAHCKITPEVVEILNEAATNKVKK